MAVNNVEIAIGQKWLTRSGQEVEVIDNDGDKTYPWDLSNSGSVTDEGFEYECIESEGDLITLIQDEHGFIPWNGGECPIPNYTEIEAKLRCGDLENEVAEWFDWSVSGDQGDIIAYRVVKQEVEPAKVGDEEEQTEGKEEPKYTIKQVFEAINRVTTCEVHMDEIDLVEEELAKTQDPDYKLYLELKAKYE